MGDLGDGRANAVIFDIDGTILKPGCLLQRTHMEAMAAAIEQVAGVPTHFEYRNGDLFLRDHSLSGFTDAGTVDLILRRGGIPATRRPALAVEIVATMCGFVARAIDGLDARVDLLPGVAALISELRRAGAIIGLSTGNAHLVADQKMRALGLDDLAELGAFGDVHTKRPDIARAALASVTRSAAAASRSLRPEDVVLIGDTPSDVSAARAAGMRSVAVATGAACLQELGEAAPDLLVTELTDLWFEDIIGAVPESLP